MSAWVCSVCGNTNPDTDRMCPKCTATQDAIPTRNLLDAPYEYTGTHRDLKRCDACGTQNQIEATQCVQCGAGVFSMFDAGDPNRTIQNSPTQRPYMPPPRAADAPRFVEYPPAPNQAPPVNPVQWQQSPQYMVPMNQAQTGWVQPPPRGAPTQHTPVSTVLAVLFFICCLPGGYILWGQGIKMLVMFAAFVVLLGLTGGFAFLLVPVWWIDYWMCFSAQTRRPLEQMEFFPNQ